MRDSSTFSKGEIMKSLFTKLSLNVAFVFLFILIGISAALADYNCNVYTPRNSKVPVFCKTYESPPAEILASNNYVKVTYPKAAILRPSSRKYNCHSYAWYSQSTSNSVWMDDPSKYWLDGSYYQYNYFAPGIKIYYVNQHSAISTGTTGYLYSKWGKLPLMYHYYTYSPYIASSLKAYKKR
jgi:hypothetical protein